MAGAMRRHSMECMQVSLKAVLPFLEGAVRGAGEQARNALVIRSLQRSEHIQLQEQLARLRQRQALLLHVSTLRCVHAGSLLHAKMLVLWNLHSRLQHVSLSLCMQEYCGDC